MMVLKIFVLERWRRLEELDVRRGEAA